MPIAAPQGTDPAEVTVRLRRPAPTDLPHRARWMSDPVTMAYNAGFDVTHPGYHRDTGCIDFPTAVWAAWLRQADDDDATGRRFHAMVEADGVVVGEAGFGVEHGAAHLHLVIEASCAGRGFGSAALALLVAEAFSRPEVELLVDDFPASRAAAERLFAAHGFVRHGDRVVLAREPGKFHPGLPS